MYDVLIVGGGVIGCSIARELSRHQLKIAVLEQCPDISMGTSKANSAIIHAGYDAKPGTMKAIMNIAGNPMYEQLSQELDFPFRRIGSLVLCFDEDSIPELEALKKRGDANGVPGLRVLNREELLEMEPNIGSRAVAALYAPSGGIVCPYEMTIALAENACANGVTFFLGRKVLAAAREEGGFRLHTSQGDFAGKVLINAAGVFADSIHNMLSEETLHIIPRAGQYCLMDKTVGGLVNHTLFQLPTVMGKGVLVSPTVDGNLLVGPTATDLEDKEDVSTTQEEHDKILAAAGMTLDAIPVREIITAFTGLRAHSVTDDFIIGEAADVPGLYDVAGIESPGLTSAPAIGKYVEHLIVQRLQPAENPGFDPIRKGIPKFREMGLEERQAAIRDNPLYGKVVCRCETVTEAEIVQAIRRPLGARDLDGVKRRTRAGMGRCQSGFCSPQVLAILARELELPWTEITKCGPGSEILVGRNKGV